MSKYPDKDKENKINNLSFLMLLMISFFLIFLSVRNISSPLKKMRSTIFDAGNSAFHSTTSFFLQKKERTKSFEELENKYNSLKEEFDFYYKRTIELELLEEENKELRNVLSFSNKIVYKNIPAKIIGRDLTQTTRIITINKGSKDGIKNNMIALSYKDQKTILIGKVIKSKAFSSDIIPVYDRNFFISAKLKNNKYESILSSSPDGINFASLTLYSTNGKDILSDFIGDQVVTSSLGEIYPDGISIGTVEEAHKDLNDEIKIKVRLDVDFKNLNYIYISEGIDK